jgi:hypothetical protein
MDKQTRNKIAIIEAQTKAKVKLITSQSSADSELQTERNINDQVDRGFAWWDAICFGGKKKNGN